VACTLAALLGVTAITHGAVVPPNNNCANAQAVGNVNNLAFDTTNATFDGPGLYINSKNIWFCYTATCTGTATISLVGSSFDTKLAIYDGCQCNPTANRLIRANDDFVGQQSVACIPVTQGHQYLIEVGGFNSSVFGPGKITIACDAQTAGPTNDNCSNAKAVGNVTNLPFDTMCATADGPGICTDGPNLWYRYTASSNGPVTVSLLGSEFDTKLGIYKGSSCYPSEEVTCNDDFSGHLESQATFQATSGQVYLIEVGGYNSDAAGQGVLSISAGSSPPPPSGNNDNCANAQAVSEVENLAFDTTNATFDGPSLCMHSPNLWYCYTASCTGDVTVSLLGSSYDTVLAIYNGCECYPTASDVIACNDDFGSGTASQATFPAVAGHQYLIEVGGYDGTTPPAKGPGKLTISCAGEPPPPPPPPVSPDLCANATAIGNVTDLPFDTSNATADGPGLCMNSANIWYCYTAACTGNVTVTLSEANYDTMLAAYEGCECYPTSSMLLQCNDDFGSGTNSQVTFAATAGNQYLIEVGGYAAEKGHGLITVSCEGVTTQDRPDLGDAPDSTNHAGAVMTAYPAGGPAGVKANYPTVHLSGTGVGPFGPAHLNARLVAQLGKKITRETEADTGSDQDGVNNIIPSNDTPDLDQGDDGVIVPLNVPTCRWTTFNYSVNVVDPNVDMYVNVWFDWNRDGDWDDTLECATGAASEWAVRNQLLFKLPVGLNTITTPAFLPWHPATGTKQIWMRITLSEQPFKGGSAPTGKVGAGGSGPRDKYLYGETEDYYSTPDLSLNICEDFNGDGVVNTQDLVAFTAAWLATCPQ
jgi:hypothetical protein